jgi:hypothetical protein
MEFWQKTLSTLLIFNPDRRESFMFGISRGTGPFTVRTRFLALVRQFFVSGGYRPNRSYMRGAGPACRANQGTESDLNGGTS